MKRSTAALFAVLLVLLMAPAARAQLGAAASVTSPGNGSNVSGTITVSGKGTSDIGVEKVELYIDGLLVDSVSPSGIQSSATVSYSWNTEQVLGGSGIAPNGEYGITVKASSKTGANAQSSIRVYVDNAPQAPTGVTASVDDKTITVTWNANSEPDLSGYQVIRDGNHVQNLNGTSYSETLQPGTYGYTVVALRSSPSQGERPSAPSRAVSATIKAPPPPKEDGGGSGGSGSGSGGGGQGRGAFEVGGTRLAPVGLPSSASLPRRPVAAGLSDPQDPAPREWGKFKKTLPYKLPKKTGSVPPDQFNIAARSPDRIIPPDGLRWVAAGLLAISAAALLWFLGSRVERGKEESAERIAAAFLNSH